jgi:hypothetical protein
MSILFLSRDGGFSGNNTEGSEFGLEVRRRHNHHVTNEDSLCYENRLIRKCHLEAERRESQYWSREGTP